MTTTRCVAMVRPGFRCRSMALDGNLGTPDCLDLCEYHEDLVNEHYAFERLIRDPRKFLDRKEPKYAAPAEMHLLAIHSSVVYFLQRSDGLIKIGTTTNLKSRRSDLEIGAGPLVVLGCISGSYETEQRIHAKFADSRQFGEWFSSSDDLLGFIKDALTRESVDTVYNQDSETDTRTRNT